MNIENRDWEKYISSQVESIIKQLSVDSVISGVTDNSFCLEEWKQAFFEILRQKLKKTQIVSKKIYLHKLFCKEKREEKQTFLIQINGDKTIDIKSLKD